MNCELCGAPPMFKKGDRVALNATWVERAGGEIGIYTLDKKATVVGHSKNPGCIRIVFDCTKTPQSFHQMFLSKIRREPMFDQT